MIQRKSLILLSLLCFLLMPLAAESVDLETAQRIALKKLNSVRGTRSQQISAIKLAHQNQASYLFTTNDEQFIIVAGDDNLPPVLAYGKCLSGEIPPPVRIFLNATELSTESLRWQNATTKKNNNIVLPLLPFVRHQKSPYNAFCPYYTDDKGNVSKERCLVGCVATALEEVISYYRRNICLKDTLHGWTTDNYTIDHILPGTQVDCKLIANNYDTDDYTAEQADAVGRLSYYCGVAARMNWGVNESGARVSRLAEPLKRAFDFGFVHYADSYQYDPKAWIEMLQNEILAGRPVLYAGYVMAMGGHAFVLDGLDADGFFHVNWGYGGNYDGYFLLEVLNFAEPKHDLTETGFYNGFFCNQEALLLHPDSIDVLLPDTLARSGKELQIDSVVLHAAAETRKLTPLSIYLQNTSQQALTTPFEIFTNLPTDTALLEQADFNALTGCTLQPGEKKRLDLHVRFNKAGERILRISPDDVAIIYELPLLISSGKGAQLTFEEPKITFTSAQEIQVEQTVSNEPGAARAGQNLIFEVCQDATKEETDGTRHFFHIYLKGGERTTFATNFRGLTPGKTYTLLVRSPWAITQQKTFTMPTANAVENETTAAGEKETRWYELTGKAVRTPNATGIYLKRTGQTTTKHLKR